MNTKTLFFVNTSTLFFSDIVAFTPNRLMQNRINSHYTSIQSLETPLRLNAKNGKDPWAEYYDSNPPRTPSNQQQLRQKSDDPDPDETVDDGDSTTLKASRFSKFAPDGNLETQDFRSQLKENMKADLERRRQEDPNRGNQPTRNYLNGL
mmetsp:Transcript_2116/g.4747  ORF Transcript_2116/g.4747 Transcript_2116/m.4747 type:complete len:150 (+) Transcript_2116:137-586(+)